MAQSLINNIGSNIQIVTGTFASTDGFSTPVTYPSGFTASNCVVASFEYRPQAGGDWRSGQGADGTTFKRTFADLQASGVTAFNTSSNYYDGEWRVMLIRFN